jgi:hypothetical protein
VRLSALDPALNAAEIMVGTLHFEARRSIVDGCRFVPVRLRTGIEEPNV